MNDRASRRRGAKTSDLRCQGTLVVVRRGTEELTRNISVLKRFHPTAQSTVPAPKSISPSSEPSDALTDNDLSVVPVDTPNQAPTLAPNHLVAEAKPSQPQDEIIPARTTRRRYHLRSSALPFIKLKDFVA
ncbi:hypothetical protein NDU88_000906 [Pleurodeles waltl]|uniref:Uncharacterized protein n=1 Tax=Pleurodeles waltl TaxID=8319 RepID=A0AAV7UR96_PLEWA|nr:hypothetical protein NDU88_000906 [Pleurodeles waltl]